MSETWTPPEESPDLLFDLDEEFGPDEEEEAQPRGFDLMAAVGHPNLAFELDESTLTGIGEKVCEEYEIDLASRKAEGYDERIEQALKLAKLAKEAKSYPWENASNVKFPLIIQAAIQFNARSYPAVVDGSQVVKGKVLGRADEAKRDRADRIAAHMSWQLLEEEDEWEEDTDQLLLRLAIVGTLVRKRYFDPIKGRQCSLIVDPQKFVVNYWAQDLATCPRCTHEITFYPAEVLSKQRAGLWLDFDLGDAPGAESDEQAPHAFLEQLRLIDLDEDGYPEPYTVTVHKETRKVARIVARWYEDGVKVNEQGEVVSIEPYECYTKYGFIPSPDGSFYDIGFGTLLGPLSETINSTINQLMDAGHLANVQGGFIGEGVSIKSGNLRFKPGEWKKAATNGAALSQNIVPLPVKEPSNVLFSLMTFLVEAAKDLTATQDILTGDTGKATTPVGTTLALIEQGLKTFTAIVKRIHRSLRRELGIMYALNARYLDPEVYFTFQDEEQSVTLDDYREGDIDVVPVSDPNMATDMQKMGRAQFLLGLRGSGLNDMEINRRALEAASVQDIKSLMPQGPPPPDPKMIVEQAKAQLKEREEDRKDAEAAANIAKTTVETEKAKMELAAMGPEFLAFAEELATRAVQHAIGMMNGGPQAPGPGQLPPMGPQPPDPGVPPMAGGPALDAGGPMGAGPGDGLPPPDQGPPPGGVGFGQLG